MPHPPARRVRIIALVLAVVLIGGGLLAWRWWRGTQASAAEVLTGAVEATQYQVAATTAGAVREVRVSEGDRVSKGDVLVVLDRRALDLQVRQADQGVVAAKAQLRQTRDDKGSKAEVDAARAKVAQAEAAVSLAKVQRGYATITAPHDGVVTSVVTNVGQNAAPGRTLVTLLDTTDLFARVFVPEAQIGQVRIGEQATATADGSGSSHDGTVSFIADQSEFTPNNIETKDQRVKLVYEVRVDISDPSGTLKPGLPVDVTFR